MPDGAKTLLVLLLIPFLLGLGHDVWFNYFSDDEKIRDIKALRVDPEKFLVSDMGWIWHEYSPDTMQAVRDTMEPEEFHLKIDPVLQLPTMVVGLIPFIITAIYLGLAWLVGFWPCNKTGGLSFGIKRKNDDFAVYKHAKTKAVKYKKR